jgi:hypothetical protein
MKKKLYILIILVSMIIVVALSTRFVYDVSIKDNIAQSTKFDNVEASAKSLAADSQKWIKLNFNAAEETLTYNFSALEFTIKAKLDELEKKSELFRTVKKIVQMSIEHSKNSIKESIAKAVDNTEDDKHNV